MTPERLSKIRRTHDCPKRGGYDLPCSICELLALSKMQTLVPDASDTIADELAQAKAALTIAREALEKIKAFYNDCEVFGYERIARAALAAMEKK